jgi:hypothetical protein
MLLCGGFAWRCHEIDAESGRCPGDEIAFVPVITAQAIIAGDEPDRARWVAAAPCQPHC